ncbi:hypothetical protein KY345_05175 [Candidatus Woesearchaeota archaeon]|nr:hypothetical protein [Candidatus Woesearchaeota archaeon]
MKEKNLYFIIIGITFLLLITPHMIRLMSYEGLIPGEDTYYHLRLADYIRQNLRIPENDPLMDRIYAYNPYHLILAGTSFIFGLELTSRIIPIILGLLTMTFFYLVMKNLRLGEKKRFFICLILALSPIFIYTFSTSSHFAIIIFLNILGFYFFIKRKRLSLFLAIVTFASIPFFNFFNALITLILLFAYTIYNRVNRRRLYLVSFGVTLRTLIYHFYIFYRFGLPQRASFATQPIIQSLVSDIGAMVGFSFFTILLAIIGLVVTWKKKKEFYYIYVVTLVLVLSSFYFGDYTNIYLNFIIVIMAGYGFFFLIDRRWQIKIIKNASLLLIICGIVFSMVSYITRFSGMQPYPEEVESLKWLEQNSDEMDIVLSHYSNGFWIEYFAKRPVILDSYFDYVNDLEQKYADSKTIFYSRSLAMTTDLLDRNDIKYIWINKQMKEGLVWTESDQGLLFLFSNKEKFKKVYSDAGVDIWEYIG